MERRFLSKVEDMIQTISKSMDAQQPGDPNSGPTIPGPRDGMDFGACADENHAPGAAGGPEWLEQENLQDLFCEMSADFEARAVRKREMMKH